MWDNSAAACSGEELGEGPEYTGPPKSRESSCCYVRIVCHCLFSGYSVEGRVPIRYDPLMYSDRLVLATLRRGAASRKLAVLGFVIVALLCCDGGARGKGRFFLEATRGPCRVLVLEEHCGP